MPEWHAYWHIEGADLGFDAFVATRGWDYDNFIDACMPEVQ